MILRMCLKDKSSVLIEDNMDNFNYKASKNQFIQVINYKTKKAELYNRDFVWCVRISSENEGDK